MASLKKDIVVNLFGKLWSAAITILLIPQYIHYLGIEAYGLIGFYATLVSSMAVLDLGLGTTLNRELAKFNSENGLVREIRDLTFSLEIVYWLVGLLICLGIISFSGLISTSWVNAQSLPSVDVKNAIVLMGIIIAFQWPISLYSGGLRGLYKQVRNSNISVIMITLRAAGVIIVLEFFSATLEAFFLWQAAITCIFVAVMRIQLWKNMPPHSSIPKFSTIQLKMVARFAAGMTSISLITFFVTEIDKIVLSKMLTLSEFGFYTLAFTIATSMSLVIIPVSHTFFPRLTKLVAGKSEEELTTLYHKAAQLMATLIYPISFVLLFFMHDILVVWTRNPDTADNTFIIARILVVGSMFNALMVMPYNLLLANGWTKFTFYQNAIAAVLFVPLLFLLTNLYGAVGAAYVWCILNFCYLIISQPLMHRRLLKKELKSWYINDLIRPMLAPFITIIFIKILWNNFFLDVQITFLGLCIISFVMLGVSFLSMPSAVRIFRSMTLFSR